jgi:hypothetical protein
MDRPPQLHTPQPFQPLCITTQCTWMQAHAVYACNMQADVRAWACLVIKLSWSDSVTQDGFPLAVCIFKEDMQGLQLWACGRHAHTCDSCACAEIQLLTRTMPQSLHDGERSVTFCTALHSGQLSECVGGA